MEEADRDFETFWKAYPPRGSPHRKQGKCRALKVWRRLQKKRELPTLDALLSSLDRDKASRQWQDPQYIPLASSWLHSKPWHDVSCPETEQSTSGSLLLDMYYRGELQSTTEEQDT